MSGFIKLIKAKPLPCLGILLGTIGLYLGIKSMLRHEKTNTKVPFVIHVSEIKNDRPVFNCIDSLNSTGLTITQTDNGLSVVKPASDGRHVQNYLQLTWEQIDTMTYKFYIDSAITFNLSWLVKGNWKIFSGEDKELKSDLFQPGKHELTMILDEGLFGPVTSSVSFDIFMEEGDDSFGSMIPESYCGYRIISPDCPEGTHKICGIRNGNEQDIKEFIIVHRKKVGSDRYSVDIDSKIDFNFKWHAEDKWQIICNGQNKTSPLFKPGKYQLTIEKQPAAKP